MSSAAVPLDFGRQEGKMHIESGKKERAVVIRIVVENGIKFLRLLFRERRPVESDSVIGLRGWSIKGNRCSLAFIDAFNEIVDAFSPIHRKALRGRSN